MIYLLSIIQGTAWFLMGSVGIYIIGIYIVLCYVSYCKSVSGLSVKVELHFDIRIRDYLHLRGPPGIAKSYL